MNNSLKTMPLRFSIGLNPLPPGDYDCQVTVLDPTGQKSAFWQAPITYSVMKLGIALLMEWRWVQFLANPPPINFPAIREIYREFLNIG